MRFWLGAFYVLPCLAGAVTSSELTGFKFSKAPTIDGSVDEAEWAGASTAEGGFDEQIGSPCPEPSKFFLAYDDDYVYFAVKFTDSKPSEIRAVEYRTNAGLGSDDYAEINIDTFGTLNAFSSFAFNPRGANRVSISGGRAAKVEWTGEIITKARITETGWEGEARIPWRLMRLPKGGKRTLRINFERYIARLQQTYDWRYTGNGNVENAGRWVDVVTPEPPFERRLQILPYIFTGARDGREPAYNAGFDFRTKITPKIETVGTVSPDFRNIENDILSLDFSYFERLGSEVRPFFREGQGFFDFGRIFSSQRVRQFDVGTRVFGNLDEQTRFGVMSLQDFGERSVLAASTQRQLAARRSVGAQFVRTMEKGRSNDAFRASYSTDIGKWNAYANALGTFDTKQKSAGFVNFGAFRDDPNGSFWMNFASMDRRFFPRLGNAFETNFNSMETGTWRVQRPSKGPIREWSWDVNLNRAWRKNGRDYRKSANVGTNVTMRKGIGFGIGANKGSFERFADEIVRGYLFFPVNDPRWSMNFGMSSGDQSGRAYTSKDVGISLRPSTRLQANLSMQWLDHFQRSRQVIFGGSLDLGRDLFLSMRGVQSDNDQNVYFSLRRSGATGNDYFLIFGDPNSRRFTRSIVFKAVIPFDLKF